jgi:argininosuccinate lyase
VRAFADMVPGIEVDAAAMRAAAEQGFSTATDLADYLARRGVPFRDAHEAVARAVRLASERGVDLAALPVADLRQFAPQIDDDVANVLTIDGSVAARNHVGGTAPEQVRTQAAAWQQRLAG